MERKVYPFRLFTIFSLSFLVGILISSFIYLDWSVNWPIFYLTVTLLFLVALINFKLKNKILIIISWGLLFILIGISWYSFFNQRSKIALPFGQDVMIRGEITNNPETDYKKQKIILKTDNYGGVRVLVNAPRIPNLNYGDYVEISGKIVKPGLIEDFDYGKYLRKYKVFGVIYQPEKIYIVGQSERSVSFIFRELYLISDKIEESLNRILSEPQASLGAGLILGVKRNIPASLIDDLNTTGLTHIIALSGYNVTIIVAVLIDCLLIYIGRRRVFWAGLFLVFVFVVMTGASPSVVRAAIFSILIIFGKTVGRKGDQTNLMLLAAVIMVAINPYILVDDLSFQLSFLAFCGLIYLSPILGRIFEKSPLKNASEFIKAPLKETFSAQIMVAPLILVTFGRLSVIAPLTNLLVLWSIPYAMATVFVASVLGLVWYPIGKIAGFLAWPLLEYIIQIARQFAKIPLASIDLNNSSWFIGLALYTLLALAVKYYYKRNKIVI